MSTEAPAAPAATPPAPGMSPTPGAAGAPAAPSIKSMVSDVFSPKPAAPAAAPATATPAAPAAPAAPAGKPAQSLHERTAPKPAAATPAAAEPEWPGEKLELPANASAEAKTNFASMKATFKQQWLAEKQARAAAEQQLATFRTAQPADATKLTELQTELQRAHDRLLLVDVQNHPDHVRQFVAPREAAIAEAKEILGFNSVELDPAGLMAKPLKEFNAAVAEATKGMNSMDATTVQTALRNAYRLRGEEQKALANVGDLHKALQSKAAKAARDAFDAVAKEVQGGEFLARFETPEGATPEERAANDAYNAGVDAVRATAEKYAFGKLDEKSVAALAHKGAVLDFMQSHVVPRLNAEYQKLHASHAALLQQIQELKGSRAPNPAGEKAPGEGQPQGSIKDMVAKAFGR